LYCSYNPESDNVFYVNKNAWAASVFRCPRLMLAGWRGLVAQTSPADSGHGSDSDSSANPHSTLRSPSPA
ncbi:MAG: hypothetical protein ACI8TX_003761, partial [Hyphomicrobiaceae bacterium]